MESVFAYHNDYNIYEQAMSELDTPTKLTVDSFLSLYETVTSRYDEYRHGCDGIETIRDWMEAEYPTLPEIVSRALSVEQLDVRAIVWLCESVGYGWDAVRKVICGRDDSWLYENMSEVSDWVEVQEWMKEQDWVVRYTDFRQKIGAPLTRFQGRTVSKMGERFGAIVVKRDGTPVNVYTGMHNDGNGARYVVKS